MLGSWTSRSLWVALFAALLCGACRLPEDRGYYRPEGLQPEPTIGTYREQSGAADILARCQGFYQNGVDDEATWTVHIQMQIASQRSRSISIARDAINVDLGLRQADGTRRLIASLLPSKIYLGKTPDRGDIVVDGFSRRAWDLFFDLPKGTGEEIPDVVLLRWWWAAGNGERVPGQCAFVRIGPEDLYLPSPEPVADAEFGLRDGYYLPGDVVLGERHRPETTEQRLHYIFHDFARWRWVFWSY